MILINEANILIASTQDGHLHVKSLESDACGVVMKTNFKGCMVSSELNTMLIYTMSAHYHSLSLLWECVCSSPL